MNNTREKLIQYMNNQGFKPIGMDFMKMHKKIYIDGLDHYNVAEYINITYNEQMFKIKRFYMLKGTPIYEMVIPEIALELTRIVMEGGMIML